MNPKGLTVAVGIVGILLICGYVSAFDVEPDVIEIQGKKGDFIPYTVTVYNDENKTINVNISVINDNPFVSSNSFKLKPFSKKQIVYGFSLNESKIAIISYEYDGETFTQLVKIEVEKPAPEIQIFPDPPVAGDVMYVMLISGNTLVNAVGMLYCKENVYPIQITQGIGSVKINETDYGPAILRIVGNDIQPIIMMINISKGEIEEAIYEIDVPQNIKLGKSYMITVKKNGAGVPASITITEPDGNKHTVETDNNGQIQVTFNKEGTWTFEVIVDGKEITATTKVSRAIINIDVITEQPMVNSAVEIRTADDATVKVTRPKNFETTLNLVNGVGSFVPYYVGEYTITARNESGEGSTTVTVRDKPHVMIYSLDRDQYITEVKKNEYVRFEIRDSMNNIIDDSFTGKVIDPRGNELSLVFTGGMATWKAKSSGIYTVVIPSKGYYMQTSMQFVVKGSGGSSVGWGYVAVVIVIVALVAGYKYKDRLMARFRGEEGEEEEIE